MRTLEGTEFNLRGFVILIRISFDVVRVVLLPVRASKNNTCLSENIKLKLAQHPGAKQ
jgi:hypothetical protein